MSVAGFEYVEDVFGVGSVDYATEWEKGEHLRGGAAGSGAAGSGAAGGGAEVVIEAEVEGRQPGNGIYAICQRVVIFVISTFESAVPLARCEESKQ